MIRLEHINKVFNAGTASEVVALKDINLTINKGEFVTMIGSNGSGKSTLLNLVAGTVMPDTGKIFLGATEVTLLPEHRRGKWIARVFQNPMAGTASELSILENFRLAAIRTRPKTVRYGTTASFRTLVKDKIAGLGLGLENKIDQPMGTLSGGQRQALTLLMAVMDDAQILLLDEPAAALDPRTADLIMKIADNLIHEFHLTAILVTHNLKDAIQYGTRIVQMQEAVVIRDITKSENLNLTLKGVYEWFE